MTGTGHKLGIPRVPRLSARAARSPCDCGCGAGRSACHWLRALLLRAWSSHLGFVAPLTVEQQRPPDEPAAVGRREGQRGECQVAPLLRLKIQQSTRRAPWALLHPRGATVSPETAPSRSRQPSRRTGDYCRVCPFPAVGRRWAGWLLRSPIEHSANVGDAPALVVLRGGPC